MGPGAICIGGVERLGGRTGEAAAILLGDRVVVLVVRGPTLRLPVRPAAQRNKPSVRQALL